MTDEDYMRRAIELAKVGTGHVAPNPLVGAVIVKDGRIIGEGAHLRYGDLHAERNALKNATEDVAGATIYVTLEPCCHTGKQPPCIEALMDAGISRVYVGSRDPNPLVSGKGNRALRERGIEVIEDFLRDECDELNEVFFHYIKEKDPFVVLKYAMTMDGKLATRTGKSQWISCEESRRHVHEQRSRYTAIMVGINTVLSDNPSLTARIEGGRNPVRIVVDTSLRTPLDSNIVNTACDIRTIIATAVTDDNRLKPYIAKDVEIVNPGVKEYVLDGESKESIDLVALMKILGEDGIDSIYVEGGASLHYSLLKEHIADKAHIYIAPKLFGGAAAKSPVGGLGIDEVSEAYSISNMKVSNIGGDIFVEGDIIY